MEFDKFCKKYKLEDFFHIRYLKNGNLDIKYHMSEGQLQDLFNHLGLWYCKIGKKSIYLSTFNGKSKEMNIQTLREQMNQAITFFILRELEKHPELNYEQLALAISHGTGISDAKLYRLYVYKEPEKRFEHFLRMKYDKDYRKDFTHEFFLNKFRELGFKETIDSIGLYDRGKKLYYKYIGDMRYIVFCILHENKKWHSYIRSFFIDYYQNETEIGQVRPRRGGSIDSSEGNYVGKFDFEDYKLIAKYLRKDLIQ